MISSDEVRFSAGCGNVLRNFLVAILKFMVLRQKLEVFHETLQKIRWEEELDIVLSRSPIKFVEGHLLA